MNNDKLGSAMRLSVALLVWMLTPLLAMAGESGNTKPVEQVTMKGGLLWVSQSGHTAPLTNEVQMPFDILVKTNGTYTVNQGRARELKEAQVLRADGMLLSPDGSLVPVYDHVIMKAGQPRIMRDGTYAVLSAPVALGDGSRITPDGFVRKTDGRNLRLLDGQMFRLDGKTIPSKDTITLRNGKVVVQKEGSLLTVAAGRTLVMNDGSKVFGDGTVILKDGSKKVLREGEVVTIEGVTVRR